MLLMFIGFGNLLYTSIFIPQYKFIFSDLLIFEAFTLIIGVFPVAACIAISYIRHLKRNLKAATSIPGNLTGQPYKEDINYHKVILKGQNKHENVEMLLFNLLYIKADGNYLHIYFIKDNEIYHQININSLTKLISELEHEPTVIRCHRAYVVNIHAIENIYGNAQGLNLN